MCRHRPRRAPKGARDRCVSPTACAPSPSPRRRRRRRARGCAPFPDRRSSCRHLYLASPRERLCRAKRGGTSAVPPPRTARVHLPAGTAQDSISTVGAPRETHPPRVSPVGATRPASSGGSAVVVYGCRLRFIAPAWWRMAGAVSSKKCPCACTRTCERCHAQPRCSCHDGCHGMKTGMNVMIMPRSPRSHHR
jgi:hypothetical protein